MHSWLGLLVGCFAIAGFVSLLHIGSAHLGGEAGQMIEENREKDIEVYAYVYSDVSDLEDFLDDESGKYGRTALVDAIKKDTGR